MPPAAATWFEPSKRIGSWKLITPIERDLAAPLWAAHDETRVAYVRHFRVRSLKAGVRLDKVISWASGYEHANILPIFGVTDVEGGAGVAVISHYEEGQPLASVLQKEHLTRNRMPTPVAVAITLDLLEALHATGGRLAPAWSHGGLRPECILITRGGRARIMELGATSVLAAVEPLLREPRWAAFGSPEQLEGTPGATSDVFTVATLFWEMLADRPLFSGRTFDEIKRKLREGRVERLDKLTGVPIPTKMADVVATALAVSPKERFETPKAFATALRRTAGVVAERHEVSEYLEQLHRVALNNRRRTLTQALGKPAPVSLPPAPSKGSSKIPAAPRVPSFGVDVSQSFLPPSLRAQSPSKPPGPAVAARTPMPSKPPPVEAPRARPRTPLPSGPPDVALQRSGNAKPLGANAEPSPVTLATPVAPPPQPMPDTPPPDSPDEPDFSAFIEDDSAIESLADERHEREDIAPLAEQLEPDVTAPSEGIPIDVSVPGAMPSIDVEMSMPGASPSVASVDVDVSLPGVVTSDTPSEPPVEGEREGEEPPTQMMEPRAEAEPAPAEARAEPTPRPVSEHPATTLTRTQRTAVYTPPSGALSDDDVMLRPRRRLSTLVIGMIVGALVAFGAAYFILGGSKAPAPKPEPTAAPEPPPPPPEPKPEPAKEPTAEPSASAPAPKTKPTPAPVVRPPPRPAPVAPKPPPKEEPPPPPPPAEPDVFE